MDESQASTLLNTQQKAIEQIALQESLSACLTTICGGIEMMLNSSDAMSSILILEDNLLRHGSAPQLPQAYCDAIDGIEIGPQTGSCGTAAYSGEQVIVEDISSSPLWENFQIATEYGLRACWSTPIFSSSGEVLGSFAIYYSTIKAPTDFHLNLISRFTHLSSLAIEQDRARKEQQDLTEQLHKSNEKLRAFAAVIPDISLILDSNGYYVDIYGGNPEDLIASADALIGQSLFDSMPEDAAHICLTVIEKAIRTRCVETCEYTLDFSNGPRTFEGRVTVIDGYLKEQPDRAHVLWVARDISEKKRVEEKIERLAFYDPLSELPNRRLLHDRLNAAIKQSNRYNASGILMFLDLDDFKRINDSLGHNAGDALLLEVARRLSSCIRETDTISRLGGDEFVIIPEIMKTHKHPLENDFITLLRKVQSCFESPFIIDQNSYRITVSIGISFIDQDHQNPEEILRQADTAMYSAKRAGGDRFTFYQSSMQHELDNRLQLESDILDAINNKQFQTYFQPQLDCHNQLIGAEALIRWKHPNRGNISPEQFIPVAEQAGLVDALQEIVLRDACTLLNRMKDDDLLDDNFTIAINISSWQFRNHTLEDSLLKVLDYFSVPPQRIKLEITEGMLIDNLDSTIEQMIALRQKAFRFSIDDFGTGYSSLSYLHTLPIDELKIDKRFIQSMHIGRGAAIVDAIVALSEHLGFSVVAEGVETNEQEAMCMEKHIHALQGYLYSRPASADDFCSWASQR